MKRIFKIYLNFYKNNIFLFIATVFQIILSGIVPVAISIYSKYFLDLILLDKIEYAIIISFFIVLIQIIKFIVKIFVEKGNLILSSSNKTRMIEDINKKICNNYSSCFDDVNYMNELNRAISFAEKGNLDIVVAINTCVARLISIFGISLLAFTFGNFVLLFVIVISVIISIILKYFYQNNYDSFRNKRMSSSRIITYFKNIFKIKNSVIDIKTNNCSLVMNKYFETAMDEYKNETLNYNKRSNKNKFFSLLNILLVDMIIYIYLGYQIIKKGMGISTFAMMVTACHSLSDTLITISNSLMSLRECVIEHSYYDKFINDNNNCSNGKIELKEDVYEIKMKDVCFKYGNHEILEKINLSIKKGQKVAIVGKNGSGKTTLINLLLGLYVPYSGEIMYNGINLQEFELSSIYNHISYLQQDSVIFNIPIVDNICLSNNSSDYSKFINQFSLDEKINNTEFGVNTKISRKLYKDGTELSGGEKQKILLARLFNKKSQIIILDEFEKFLDENTKKIVFDYIKKLNKTVILITHNVANCEFADVIFKIDDKQILTTTFGEINIK